MKEAAPEANVSVESLVSQVADEFMQRLERGDQPLVADYVRRYPELARVLQQVLPALQALREAPGPLPEVVSPTRESGCLGDFRLLGEIGRGGMGVVYEAEQISLERRVALKVLPFAATLDSRQLQRFKNEAQAAAHLHHSNIVPVFGVGCERGVHYYAMQFIEGQPLSNLIRELRQPAATGVDIASGPSAAASGPGAAETAPLRARLTTEGSISSAAFFRNVAGLGIQAAEALEYAHQHGIVHRDIKPANLLLDMGGNLWITDFGLAQCHSDLGLTMTGDLVGTVRYMSPEQTLGRRGNIDHRTDLYSLGVTLYELLTLEPAFIGKDREELLRQIASEEAPAPRRRNPAVPDELDTVVLKAMAKVPAERYGTAQELADDLRRFLSDQPIQARRPSVAQWVQKWGRRHKTAVRTGLLALVATLVALLISTVLIWRAKNETDAALNKAEQNFQEALVQRKAAEIQRQRARQAVDDYFTAVSENALLEVPGLQPLRKELLEAALKYYEEVLQETGGDVKVQVEAAAAYIRVGQIHAAVDAPDSARAALEKCFGLLEGLQGQERPAEVFGPLAGIYQGGRLMHRSTRPTADPDRSLHVLGRGAVLWEKFARADPQAPGFRSDLAGLHASMGEIQAERGRRSEALASFQNAHTLWEKLVREHAAVPAYQAGLAGLCDRLGLVLRQTGKFDDALHVQRQGLEYAQKLVTKYPGVRPYQEILATSYEKVGTSLSGTNPKEAETALRKALVLFGQLGRDFPSVPAFREEQAVGHFNLANLLSQTRRPQEAEAAFGAALDLMERLAADFPGQSDYRRRFAMYAYGTGLMLGNNGRTEDAAQMYKKALRIRRELVAEFPSASRYQAELAWQLATCPSAELRAPEEALILARQALAASPRNGNRWVMLGIAHYRTGDWAAAVKALEQSLEFPSVNSGREWFLAMSHWQLGRTDEARRWYDRAGRQKQAPHEESHFFRAEAAELLK